MYIKEKNGKVVIYEVRICDELKKIRNELIVNYSDVEIITEETTNYWEYINPINKKDSKTIIVSYRATGKRTGTNDELYNPSKSLYEVKLKKYKYPDIVIYINEFLDGNFYNLPKLKEFIKPKKLYRLNDNNREIIQNLLPYKDYIKKIIACIKIEKIKEKQITSLSDLLELIENIDDEKFNIIYNDIMQKLNEDSKKLSYLMEENND